MHRHRRAGLAVVALAALAVITAGCNGDDDGADTTAADPTTEDPTTTMETTTTTGETNTTTATTTTTTTTTTLPPTTDTTSTPSSTSVETTDWRLVVETLRRHRQELYHAPDPTRATEVCSPQSSCEANLVAQLTDFATRGEHVEGDPPDVVNSAEVLDIQADPENPDPSNPLLVTLRITYVVQASDAHRIVDSNGNTVVEVEPSYEPGTERTLRVTLTKSGTPDDPWRILDEEPIGNS